MGQVAFSHHEFISFLKVCCHLPLRSSLPRSLLYPPIIFCPVSSLSSLYRASAALSSGLSLSLVAWSGEWEELKATPLVLRGGGGGGGRWTHPPRALSSSRDPRGERKNLKHLLERLLLALLSLSVHVRVEWPHLEFGVPPPSLLFIPS